MPRTKGATNIANRQTVAPGAGFPIVFGLGADAPKAAVKVREQGGPVLAVTFQWIINFLSPIIGILIPAISAPLRSLIEDGLQKWYDTAKGTPNPWDNFLVEFIAQILKVTLK